MLEDVKNIFECERILSQQLSTIRLIGQIPFVPDDVVTLREYVRDELIRGGVERLQELMEHTPASLACFLVWEGTLKYDGSKGDYWSAITAVFPVVPAGLEVKLGRFFLQFLKKHQLPVFDKEGKTYITSILAHGGVPDSCLDDFFEHLLLPFVSDRLDLPSDSGAAELIDEWQENQGLFHFSHKPVSRFLLYGSDVAVSFLQRCLQMAAEFYDSERPLATDLDLPNRILAKFSEWWEIEQEKKEKKISLNRFRRPFLMLNPDEGEILLVLSEQRFQGMREDVSVSVAAGDELLFERSLTSYYRTSTETERAVFLLEISASEYLVCLRDASELLKTWQLNGLHHQIPYLIFHEDSCTRIRHSISNPRFWIVLPESYHVQDETCILEEGGDFYGDWENYRTYLVDCSQKSYLNLLSDTGDSHVLEIQQLEPFLHGGIILPGISVGSSERIPVFAGCLPDIHIPLARSSDIERWHVTIESLTHEKRVALLKEALTSVAPQIVTEQGQELWALSLASLFEDRAPGLFRIFLRGPLGLEKEFHLGYLSCAELHFDREFYGSESGCLTLTTDSNETIELREPPFRSYTGRAVINFPAAATEIGIQLESSSARSLALTVHIPRIRWRFRGLPDGRASLWSCQSLEIDLQCWEQYAEQLELLLDLPEESGQVWLEHIASSQKVFPIQAGKRILRFDRLRQFSDSIRHSGKVVTLVFLIVKGKSTYKLPVFAVRTTWEVEDLSFESDVSVPGERTVLFSWRDKGRFTDRVIRLHNLTIPQQASVVVPLEDGESSVLISRPFQDFLPGSYRLEFAIEDEWGQSEATTIKSFTFQIGEDREIQQQLSVWKLEGVQTQESLLGGRRRVHFSWLSPPIFTKRVLFAQNLSVEGMARIEESIPDGASGVTIERPVLQFLPGKYHIEIGLQHSWAELDPLPPERCFDVQIGREDELQDLLRALRIRDFQYDSSKEDSKRLAHFQWKVEEASGKRLLRLRNLSCPWLSCIEETIPANVSHATVQRALSEFLPGRYRVEFPIPELEMLPESWAFHFNVQEPDEHIPFECLHQHQYIMSIAAAEDSDGNRIDLKQNRYVIDPERWLEKKENDGEEDVYSGKILSLNKKFRKDFPPMPIHFSYNNKQHRLTLIENQNEQQTLYCHSRHHTLLWRKDIDSRQNVLVDWQTFFAASPQKTADQNATLSLFDTTPLFQPRSFHIHLEKL